MRRWASALLCLVITGLALAWVAATHERETEKALRHLAAALGMGREPPLPAPSSMPPEPRSPTSQGKPNVVLILLDTLRADKVGHLGEGLPDGLSPQLDAYAARGVTFERAIAQSSWTRPSTGSLLTSLHPRTLGIYREQWDPLPERAITLAEALRDAGYRTVGLTANPNLNRVFHFHQGFDVYVGSRASFGWMEDSRSGALHPPSASMRSARELFQLALELVRSEHEGPTYLQVNVMEMHETMRDEMFRPGYLDLFVGEEDHRYLAMLRQVSDDVGAFIHELSTTEGFEDTIFIVTSDHGEGLTSHPSVRASSGHGRLLYDSQLWVPLVFYDRGRRVPAGRRIERAVRLLDVMPTVLELLGLEPVPGMQGVSLMPLFPSDEAEISLPELFFAETHFRGVEKVAVVSADYKYIEDRDARGGAPEQELQPNHILEDGDRTAVGDERPDLLDAHAAFLAAFEESHAAIEPVDPSESIDPAEAAQLEALGYIE